MSGMMTLLTSCSDLKSDLPQASTGALTVHPDGWATPATANFHGQAIRQVNWDLRECRTCHGNRYDGGTSNVSCLKCHTGAAGPEDCSTCHGSSNNPAPPRGLSSDTARTVRGVGAHQIHLTGGTISSRVACNACHLVPTILASSGHVDNSISAEVRFDTATFAGANQSYNSVAGTCASSYCHGNFPNGNSANAVSWTDVSGNGAKCGTCHGDVAQSDPEDRARPKTVSQGGTHPDKGAFGTTKCANCHGFVVDANLNFVDKAKHINGQIN